MPLYTSLLRCGLVVVGIAASAGRVGIATAGTHAVVSSATSATLGDVAALRFPALIALDGTPRGLVYWPIAPGGGTSPTKLQSPPGLNLVGSLAANGERIVIPNGSEIIEYDLRRHYAVHLPNPYGIPIDVAIGKNERMYVTDYDTQNATGNVVEYAPGSRMPRKLTCASIGSPQGIAVDNEGDVFVNQMGSFSGVVEFAKRGGDFLPCTIPVLKPILGLAGGIAVDPRTDDLLVLDNPGYCEGGPAGRVTTYPRPYREQTGRSRIMGTRCSDSIRLSADSTLIFIGDEAANSTSGII